MYAAFTRRRQEREKRNDPYPLFKPVASKYLMKYPLMNIQQDENHTTVYTPSLKLMRGSMIHRQLKRKTHASGGTTNMIQ